MVVVCLPALRPLLKNVGAKRKMKQRSASQAQFAKEGQLSPSVNDRDEDDDFSDADDSDDDDLDSVASYNGHHPHGFDSPAQTDSYRMSTIEKPGGPGSMYSDNSGTNLIGNNSGTGMGRQRSLRSPPPQRFNQQYVPKRAHQDFGFEDESNLQVNHIPFEQHTPASSVGGRNSYINSHNNLHQAAHADSLYGSQHSKRDSFDPISPQDNRRSLSPPPFEQRSRHAQGASMYMSSPLPVPPSASSGGHDEDDYIMPSYILNEPLPNPVI